MPRPYLILMRFDLNRRLADTFRQIDRLKTLPGRHVRSISRLEYEVTKIERSINRLDTLLGK